MWEILAVMGAYGKPTAVFIRLKLKTPTSLEVAYTAA
jgi:hypothetical protein